MLIRTTMIALHQANVTGNYTVLRDLGASILQSANTAADLAVLFAPIFARTAFSLAPTVLFDAILDQKPALTTNGVLKLVGHFPTKPQEVIFDLTFAYEAGGLAHRAPERRHPHGGGHQCTWSRRNRQAGAETGRQTEAGSSSEAQAQAGPQRRDGAHPADAPGAPLGGLPSHFAVGVDGPAGDIDAALPFKLRPLDAAAVEGQRTARMKGAARRRVDRRRQLALKLDALPLARRIGDRRRRQQRARIGVARIA